LTQPPVSPRVAALRQDLEAGDAAALVRFWAEVEAAAAPLVEPVSDDDRHVLVTFLWRGGEDLRNVVLVGGPAGFGAWARNQLSRVPGTDLWFRTYRVRRDTRTVYRLLPNDALLNRDEVEDDKAWEERTATFQPDPLNPRRYVFPRNEKDPDSKDLVVSLLELPGAPPQPWVARRPGVPAGTVQAHRLRSEILGNERDVWVYVPPGYGSTDEPHGLALIFDGNAYTRLVPTPTILDNLLADGRIPPLVAVLPSNPDQETRTRELPAHPPFAEFLAAELIPWARANYHLTTDPSKAVVAGSSFGGLAATYAGLTHPELFGNVLSQSGSFWWQPDWQDAETEAEFCWHARQFATRPRLPLRFYLEVGLLETGRPPRDDHPGQIIANRHLRDVLEAKGYPVQYAEFCGGHDYLCWQGSLADGLIALLGTPGAREATRD